MYCSHKSLVVDRDAFAVGLIRKLPSSNEDVKLTEGIIASQLQLFPSTLCVRICNRQLVNNTRTLASSHTFTMPVDVGMCYHHYCRASQETHDLTYWALRPIFAPPLLRSAPQLSIPFNQGRTDLSLRMKHSILKRRIS